MKSAPLARNLRVLACVRLFFLVLVLVFATRVRLAYGLQFYLHFMISAGTAMAGTLGADIMFCGEPSMILDGASRRQLCAAVPLRTAPSPASNRSIALNYMRCIRPRSVHVFSIYGRSHHSAR